MYVPSLFRRALRWFLYGELANDKKAYPKYKAKIVIYRSLGIATVGYVAVQLAVFHLQLASIPQELVLFWMLALPGYIILKEAFRWAFRQSDSFFGEFFALLIILGFFWMEGFNLYRKWCLGEPYLALPDGYFKTVVEAFGLLVISTISSLLFHSSEKRREKAV